MNDPPRKERLPLMLSAFVYPGAGQFAQKRWIPGAVFTVSFTFCFGLVLLNVFRPMAHNLRVSLDFADGMSDESFERVSASGVLVPLAAALLLYVVSIVDVSRARTRRPPPSPPSG